MSCGRRRRARDHDVFASHLRGIGAEVVYLEDMFEKSLGDEATPQVPRRVHDRGLHLRSGAPRADRRLSHAHECARLRPHRHGGHREEGSRRAPEADVSGGRPPGRDPRGSVCDAHLGELHHVPRPRLLGGLELHHQPLRAGHAQPRGRRVEARLRERPRVRGRRAAPPHERPAWRDHRGRRHRHPLARGHRHRPQLPHPRGRDRGVREERARIGR